MARNEWIDLTFGSLAYAERGIGAGACIPEPADASFDAVVAEVRLKPVLVGHENALVAPAGVRVSREDLELAHRQHLEHQLAHQKDMLAKQAADALAALEKRLEQKRVADLAGLAKQKDEDAAAAARAAQADKETALQALEADWHARREEAVKVNARNMHDMHQEALRKALFDKDKDQEEAIEKLTHEKDAHHVEIMQQMATQRDEEHHTRLVDELEAVEAENKVGGWVSESVGG